MGFGEMVEVDLKDNGRNIEVTDANKKEYVDLMVDYTSRGCVGEQMQALVEGFHELVGVETLTRLRMSCTELNKLFLGEDEVDVHSIEALAKYTGGYDELSLEVRWFWRAFE